MSGHLVAGTLYELKTLVACWPAIALPLQRWRGRGVVVSERTEIVIESFPRTASSFAVAAFRIAQEPDQTIIAHHTHMPAQVLEAAHRGIPALVLIRDVEDAVISILIWKPHLSVSAALRGYIHFYEPLVPNRSGFVLGTFDEVRTDFGALIVQVNERFGTDFRPFEHTPEHLLRIGEEIEADFGSRADDLETLERMIPRPSALREDLKVELRARYRTEAADRLRRRAERIFQALVQ